MHAYPVTRPRITGLVIDGVVRARHEPNKPKAFDTPFRYSDAGACGRRMVYASQGVEAEGMDLAGQWVTSLGTLIHEAFQDRALEEYPDAEAEVPTEIDGLTSGSCDLYLPDLDGLPTVYELKTKGAFAYDKALGYQRSRYKVGTPAGPPASVLIQAGLNARGLGARSVIVGYTAMEAVSKGFAERGGLSDSDRVCAEWRYSTDDLAPMVDDELRRLEHLRDDLAAGRPGPRVALDDAGDPEHLDPLSSRRPWQCQYCPFLATCVSDDR